MLPTQAVNNNTIRSIDFSFWRWRVSTDANKLDDRRRPRAACSNDVDDGGQWLFAIAVNVYNVLFKHLNVFTSSLSICGSVGAGASNRNCVNV